jgi:hypothetical protein
MTIAAVVVTYNRLSLLKECLEAISLQTCKVNSIIVVNNASTDGTTEYLQQLDDKQIVVKSLEKNIGGAGGFAEGIAIATKMNVDAIWIMDDDTIPQTDALEHLVYILNQHENTGFVNSKVVWTDGNIHQMNIPGYVHHDDLGGGLYAIRSASFVSLLVPSKIVREVGLPYREFFIWVDDAEFTARIVKAGHKGYLTTSSVVVHKTATNYGASIKTATPEAAWKFYYYMRNGMFASRGEKPWIIWFFKNLNHLRLDIHRTKNMAPELRSLLKNNLWRGFVDGLTFSPRKEFVD